MSKRQFVFNTRAEAEAFAEGVEYVNDSAVSVDQIVTEDDKWVVYIVDED